MARSTLRLRGIARLVLVEFFTVSNNLTINNDNFLKKVRIIVSVASLISITIRTTTINLIMLAVTLNISIVCIMGF